MNVEANWTWRVEGDPRPAPAPRRPAPAAPEAAPGAVAGMRVLVAEDHEPSRLIACRLLRRLGCHVEGVADGLAAVEILDRAEFDLVLMDVQMPVLDGLDATRQIRLHESRAGLGRRVPIVAYTGLDPARAHSDCLAAGLDDLLPKPAGLDDLLACLLRWHAAAAS